MKTCAGAPTRIPEAYPSGTDTRMRSLSICAMAKIGPPCAWPVEGVAAWLGAPVVPPVFELATLAEPPLGISDELLGALLAAPDDPTSAPISVLRWVTIPVNGEVTRS